MTSSIKPPGSPSAPPAAPPDRAEGREPMHRLDGNERESFRAKVDAETPDPVDAASTPAVSSADSMVALVEEVRSGRLTPGEAIERLVARALESPEARQLTEEGRRELALHLRESLADDPALARLRRDFERSS